MKITSRPLTDFIIDFELFPKDNGICFDAIIDFNVKGNYERIYSEVHIVTINAKHIDTIYLLNPHTLALGIPDLFQDNKEVFSYINKECLMIAGTCATGEYVVLIYPENNDCANETLRELKAKKYN